MSWSLTYIGKPSKIVEALNVFAAKQTDQCKVEFDDALPHLIGLVQQNFVLNKPEPVLRIVASGYGYEEAAGPDKTVRMQTYRTCTVTIENLHGTILG